MNTGDLYVYRPHLPIRSNGPGYLDESDCDRRLNGSVIVIADIVYNTDCVIGKFKEYNYYTLTFNYNLTRAYVFHKDQLIKYKQETCKPSFIAYEPTNLPGLEIPRRRHE